ncbi:MAG: M23 family metallopeptidase [Coriobacteriia bacterium]|nr:M23 family metallopeptidase [Coriobacteriia bacterium]
MSPVLRPLGRRVRVRVAVLTAARPSIRVVLVGALMVVALLTLPATAHAGWPLARDDGTLLAFGATYADADGGGSQHRGVDLRASAGDAVLAPLAGEVTFVGSVPGVGGGRVRAMTIATASGAVTLLPFDGTTVARGERVSAGDRVGTLAGSGDGSSSELHVHVGVRTGSLYIDPLGVLAPPATTPQQSAELPEAAGAAAHAAAGASLGSGVSVAGGARVMAPGGEIAPGVSVATRGARARASSSRTQRQQGRASAGGSDLQQTVLTASGVVVAAGSTAAPAQAPTPATWLADLVGRVRAVAVKSARVAGLVVLAVLAALGALWPLWRSDRKGAGKVLVSGVGEDVAAVPGR